MKNVLKTHNLLKSFLLIAMILFIASQSNGQQTKHAAKVATKTKYNEKSKIANANDHKWICWGIGWKK